MLIVKIPRGLSRLVSVSAECWDDKIKAVRRSKSHASFSTIDHRKGVTVLLSWPHTTTVGPTVHFPMLHQYHRQHAHSHQWLLSAQLLPLCSNRSKSGNTILEITFATIKEASVVEIEIKGPGFVRRKETNGFYHERKRWGIYIGFLILCKQFGWSLGGIRWLS